MHFIVQVKQELTDFINQKHSPKEQGDLMMMVLSDRVNQSGKSTGQCYTMFDLAHIIMNRATAQGRRIAVLVHVREGVHLIASSRDPCTSSPHGKLLTDPVNGTPLTQVSDGVQQVDDHPEFGLRVPVVVIVYHMGGRSATIRSMLRVITHSIAAYTAGRTSAAVHQMLMRYAGLTQQVRLSTNSIGQKDLHHLPLRWHAGVLGACMYTSIACTVAVSDLVIAWHESHNACAHQRKLSHSG